MTETAGQCLYERVVMWTSDAAPWQSLSERDQAYWTLAAHSLIGSRAPVELDLSDAIDSHTSRREAP